VLAREQHSIDGKLVRIFFGLKVRSDNSNSGNGADGCMGEGKTLQVPKRSKRKVRGRRRSHGSDGGDLAHGTGSEYT
jgi:hypothetical protein